MRPRRLECALSPLCELPEIGQGSRGHWRLPSLATSQGGFSPVERREFVKAITVREPFASLIVRGPKAVENRSHRVAWRGLVAIHAGKRVEADALADYPQAQGWPLTPGAVIGVARLADCVPVALCESPFAVGPWCLILEERRPLPRPVACSGQLGVWTLPPAVAAAVEAQLG